VIATFRYTMADVVRSNRFALPLVPFVVGVPLLYSNQSPPLDGYAATAALLYPVAAWFGVAVCNSEDDVRLDVTIATKGGWLAVYAAKLLTALLLVLALVPVAVAYPILARAFAPPASRGDVLIGIAAHLLCALPGLALGVLFSRLVIRRQAYALLWLLICLVAAVPIGTLASAEPLPLRLLAHLAPPVLGVARALSGGTPAGGHHPVGPPLLPDAIGALLFCAAATAAFLKLARARA
jgi:hypothetical protein